MREYQHEWLNAHTPLAQNLCLHEGLPGVYQAAEPSMHSKALSSSQCMYTSRASTPQVQCLTAPIRRDYTAQQRATALAIETAHAQRHESQQPCTAICLETCVTK